GDEAKTCHAWVSLSEHSASQQTLEERIGNQGESEYDGRPEQGGIGPATPERECGGVRRSPEAARCLHAGDEQLGEAAADEPERDQQQHEDSGLAPEPPRQDVSRGDASYGYLPNGKYEREDQTDIAGRVSPPIALRNVPTTCGCGGKRSRAIGDGC
ncbi:MAG: hypothetical protein ACXVA4_12870, partial [Ktedonobacterales bacterium]